jgi:hypothetical protein
MFPLFFYAQSSLVAYYPFNGNANDLSGNANNGTVNGATLTTDRFGVANSAYYFDGSSYISIADNPNINIQAGESFTISYWCKYDAQNNATYLISKYKGSFGEPSYALGAGSGDLPYSWFEFTAGNGIENRGAIHLYDTNWHNITTVFKSGVSITIYVDGVLDISNSITYAGSIINGRNLTIGSGSNLAQFYKGAIDDIKIYKKALSIQEIQNEVDGLIAYYPFNGNANDESGNNHNGTVYGATLTDDRNGSANSAYYFDGVNNYIDLGDWENGGAMTFAFWARWDAFNNYSRIVDLGNGSSSNNIIVANYQTNNGLFFSAYNGASETRMWISTISLNQWDFYTATVDESGIMTIYKNGQQIAQKTDGFKPNYILRTAQFIGKSNFSADGYFNGAMDDIRIYNTALSATEILNLYDTQTLAVETENLNTNLGFYINNNTLYFKNTQNLNEIKNIEVYNLLGQKVFETSKIKRQIPINNLQKEMYILKVEDKNSNYNTLKFLSY